MTRIVVVGDRIVDRYVHGRLEPCQDGCQKFIEEKMVEVPGGAANAARSLQHADCKVFFFSDTTHETKIRYMDDGHCAFRVDIATKQSANLNWWQRDMVRWLQDNHFDAVYIADYNKGFITDELIAEIIRLCNQRKVLVVVDPRRNPKCCAGAIIKCNEEYAQKHAILNGNVDFHNIVITRGAEGPYYFGATFPPGPPVECRNHVGAGDCFGAWLTLKLAQGMSMGDAICCAHAAGRVYVQYPHNRPPKPEEIECELEQVKYDSKIPHRHRREP